MRIISLFAIPLLCTHLNLTANNRTSNFLIALVKIALGTASTTISYGLNKKYMDLVKNKMLSIEFRSTMQHNAQQQAICVSAGVYLACSGLYDAWMCLTDDDTTPDDERDMPQYNNLYNKRNYRHY